MNIAERAQMLREGGDLGGALQLLKPAALADRPPFDNRRALAELYREIGCPDQAGRWGIILDGWTTARERDRLARLLAATGIEKAKVRAFLAVPTDAVEPPELTAVIDTAVPVYRAKFDRRYERSYLPKPTHVRLSDAVANVFVWAAVVGFLAAILTGVLADAAGGAAALVWAASLAVAATLFTGAGLIVRSVARAFESQWNGAALRLSIGIVFVIVGGALFRGIGS